MAKRKLATTAIIVFFAVFILSAAGATDDAGSSAAPVADIEAASAQLDQLTADVQRLMSDLNQLRAEKVPTGGAVELILAVELADRRDRFRSHLPELRDALQALRKAGDARAKEEEWLKDLLLADATILSAEITATSRNVITYLNVTTSSDDAERTRAISRLSFEIPESDRLYKALAENIQMRESLGLDASADGERLSDQLNQRGRWLGGILRTFSLSLDNIEENAGDPADTVLAAQLNQLNRLNQVVVTSTRATIRLLETFGQPTGELSEALITLTGTVSDDLLNFEVLQGLAANARESVSNWFQAEGLTLILKLLLFGVIVLVARFAARFAERLARHGLERSRVRTSNLLKDFFIKSAGGAVFVLGLLIAIAQLGIEVGHLLAGLGIAGFVIGFALQDVLSNFASGLMILAYRPFDVGDLVEAGGVSGKVRDMTLVSTKILTLDNQLLFVPNNKIWGDVVRNVTHQRRRRVDLVFGIGYGDDIAKAEKILESIVRDHEQVLDDPEFVVKLHELGESSVNFIVRPWVKTDDYWDVYWDITRQVKERFDAGGISIPFPQRDVHVYQETRSESGLAQRVSPASGLTRDQATEAQVTEDRMLDHSDEDA
jgi:small conductance mechanosensitive channel